MKQLTVPSRMENYLSRQLTSSLFTWREILQMTVPYVLDSLSIMLIGMLITALISKNGDTSIAATSLVGPITNLVCCVFNGIGVGGTVVVAQCCGTKDSRLISRASGQVVWMTVAIGVVACLPMLLFPRQILLTLYPDAEAAVLDKGVVFFSGSVWSILPFTLYTGIFSVLRGMGESKKCLCLSVIINVAYLLFSLLFLNWLNLDIRGSVYALVLARFLGAVAAVALLFFIHPPVRIPLRNLFSFDKRLCGANLKVSIPSALEQIFITCGSIVANVYMVILGTEAIATNAMANSLLGVLYAGASAASSLAVTVVGRCVGAGKREEAVRYGRVTVWIGMAILLLAALIFYPALPLLLRMYNQTPAVNAVTVRLLVISLPFLLVFWSASNTMPSTLRAGNDTVFPSVYALVVMWVVNIGLGYTLSISCGLGLTGVWIAMWVSWVVRAIGFGLRFRSGVWLRQAELKA